MKTNVLSTDRATLSNVRASASCRFACATSRRTMRISHHSDRALSPEICISPEIAKRQFGNRSASFRRDRVAVRTENSRTRRVYCKYLLRKQNTCSEFAMTAPNYLSSGCSDFFKSFFLAMPTLRLPLAASRVPVPSTLRALRTHQFLRPLVIHQSSFVGRRRATVDNSRSRPA